MTRKLDSTIAVAGGSAGIGLATAKHFVAEGATVFFHGSPSRRATFDRFEGA